jgi:hypothetical protein
MGHHLRFGRHGADVGCDFTRQLVERSVVEEFEARDRQVLILGQRNAGPPLVPARLSTVIVELGADEANDDGFSSFSYLYKVLSDRIIYHRCG